MDNKKTFEDLLTNTDEVGDLSHFSVGIWSAGNVTDLYKNCVERVGIHPINYIDVAKRNTKFQGVDVLSNIKEFINSPSSKNNFVLVNADTPNSEKIMIEKCSKLGVQAQTLDAYVFSRYKDKILEVYDFLEDDFSKKIYIELITSRLQFRNIDENMVIHPEYFCLPKFLLRRKDEIFIDCGAYVGDTIEQYINAKCGIFEKIYAFEPLSRNYNAMLMRTNRIKKEWALSDDKIQLIKAAVGKTTENVVISSSVNDSPALEANFSDETGDNKEQLQMYSLDDYFKNQYISFLKADIESYEYDMLLGAKNTIKRDNPLITVCIYHNAADLIEIPLFIKGINPNYKIAIRHHSYEWPETILYAWI